MNEDDWRDFDARNDHKRGVIKVDLRSYRSKDRESNSDDASGELHVVDVYYSAEVT